MSRKNLSQEALCKHKVLHCVQVHAVHGAHRETHGTFASARGVSKAFSKSLDEQMFKAISYLDVRKLSHWSWLQCLCEHTLGKISFSVTNVSLRLWERILHKLFQISVENILEAKHIRWAAVTGRRGNQQEKALRVDHSVRLERYSKKQLVAARG